MNCSLESAAVLMNEPSVLITAGSSLLSQAIALEFARSGYRVVLVDKADERLERAAEELRMISGRGNFSVEKIPDIWINSPPTVYWGEEGQTSESEWSSFREQAETAARYLYMRGGGLLINIGPSAPPYEAAVCSLSDALRDDMRGSQVDVVTAIIGEREQQTLLQLDRIIPPQRTAAAHRVAKDVLALANRPATRLTGRPWCEVWVGRRPKSRLNKKLLYFFMFGTLLIFVRRWVK